MAFSGHMSIVLGTARIGRSVGEGKRRASSFICVHRCKKALRSRMPLRRRFGQPLSLRHSIRLGLFRHRIPSVKTPLRRGGAGGRPGRSRAPRCAPFPPGLPPARLRSAVAWSIQTQSTIGSPRAFSSRVRTIILGPPDLSLITCPTWKRRYMLNDSSHEPAIGDVVWLRCPKRERGEKSSPKRDKESSPKRAKPTA